MADYLISQLFRRCKSPTCYSTINGTAILEYYRNAITGAPHQNLIHVPSSRGKRNDR